MQEPLVPARIRQAKEKTNNDSKAEERGDSIPAGRPSNWEESRKPSFSGRRSRRNSFSDDSQLTIENFGGSQDQLNTVGRFERERKISNTSLTSIEPVVPARSSLADARGSIQFGYDTDSGNEKQDRDTEKLSGSSSGTLRRHNSTTLHSNSSPMSHPAGDTTSGRGGGSVERDAIDGDGTSTTGSVGGMAIAAAATVSDVELTPRRKTSFAAVPNTTTWQQQAISVQRMDDVDDAQPLEDATKISTIKLKLEEKRRMIEQEKRRIESAWTKQLQTVGKQAFLQAISKSKSGSNVAGEPDSTAKESNDGATIVDEEEGVVEKAERPCSLKDLDDHSKYEQKWNAQIIEPKKTPDLENMDLEQYQVNNADIQRLTQQQNQIQAQTLQAQQLLHAQQIANLLNQQYGSQQSIPATTYRPMNTQMFGSSPHLPQQQSSPINYGMRPPSRDPYLSQPHQQQQQQQQHTMQYINEQGQYVQQQQQQSYGHHPNSHLVYSREQSQTQLINDQNGGNQYRTMSKESHQYSSNPYLNMEHHQQQQQQQQQFYHQDSNHYRDPYQPQQLQHAPELKDPAQPQQQPHGGQFFLHESNSTPPQPTQRRTWAQSAAAAGVPLGGSPLIPGRNASDNNGGSMVDVNAWNHGPKTATLGYNRSPAPSGGFSLHHNGGGDGDSGYGGGSGRGGSGGSGGSQQSFQNLFEVHHPHHAHGQSAASPQHSKVRNQISQMMISNGAGSPSAGGPMMVGGGGGDYRDNRSMPLSPPIDDMAPQSISFIGDEDTGDMEINTSKGGGRNDSFSVRQQQQQQQQLDALYGSSKSPAGMRNNGGTGGANVQDLDKHLSKLNITSGNRTYRIPSPTRPSLNSNSFHDPQDDVNEKGFYISFDNEQPKRPKPPLRTKRSPKKDKPLAGDSNEGDKRRDSMSDKPSTRETNANNYGTYSVKTASSFSSSFNEEHNASHARKSIIADNSGVSPFEPVVHKVNVTGSGSAASPSPMMMMHQHQQQDHVDRRYVGGLEDNLMSGNGHYSSHNNSSDGYGSETERKAKIVIDVSNDPSSVDEMERKKEKIMLLSLQRRQQAEEAKARKEIEAMQRREKEREKEEERARKKEEQFARRQQILEAHKLKKAIEEAEREGKTIDRELQLKHQQYQQQLHQTAHSTTPTPAAKMRTQKLSRPRPKTIHVESGSVDLSEASSLSSRGKKGSNSNLTGLGMHSASNTIRRDYYRGSQDSLAIREPPATIERGRTLSRISLAKGANFRGRKSNSLMNLCDSDSGLGRATPPRRAPSPGMGPSSRHLPSPSGPGSLPPGLITKRRGFDDGSSDISSNASSMMDYNGPRLYKQPATKSNRGIILNAVEYCVFPGAVNRDAKQKVLEKIARSEAKHFLVLFRDAGCQFRALYGYWPENEQIIKLYGTGPSQVDDVMFDKFFKYNSGGKCFTQVHTKHLTVTIDAFTIHNSLWQGKKANLPSKKDMALVI
uniref:CKK domain-containing protein n=1 Tax=Anopheles dirus TaxID=7168 RepID=A0A182N2I7_9DIPT